MTTGFTIVNPHPPTLQAIAAKHGLKAIKLGGRLNSSYTPTRCRAVAEAFTGRKFKARDYDAMIRAIDDRLAIVRGEKLPDVAVYAKHRGCFIPHITCEGERRVRIDVHDSLDNYEVYEVTSDSTDTFSARRVQPVTGQPLTNWEIHLS